MTLMRIMKQRQQCIKAENQTRLNDLSDQALKSLNFEINRQITRISHRAHMPRFKARQFYMAVINDHLSKLDGVNGSEFGSFIDFGKT